MFYSLTAHSNLDGFQLNLIFVLISWYGQKKPKWVFNNIALNPPLSGSIPHRFIYKLQYRCPQLAMNKYKNLFTHPRSP